VNNLRLFFQAPDTRRLPGGERAISCVDRGDRCPAIARAVEWCAIAQDVVDERVDFGGDARMRRVAADRSPALIGDGAPDVELRPALVNREVAVRADQPQR